MSKQYIGADVHATSTNLSANRNGKIIKRFRVPTRIPALLEVLEQVKRPRTLVVEEGPMVDWLRRNLAGAVDEFIACDPRVNRLIYQDGDKDDPIDADKISELARGGFIRPVHHSDDVGRILLKQWVAIYHERVRQAVRMVNRLRALARRWGIRMPGRVLRNPSQRCDWLAEGVPVALLEQLEFYWPSLDLVRGQAKDARKQLVRRAKPYPVVAAWQAAPGVGVIRATTLLAYLDTPWRFQSPNRIWTYCGVGLRRRASGSDLRGRPKRGIVLPATACNRVLKCAVMGAAISAIHGNNVFAERYQHLRADGKTPGNARRTIARRLVAVLWGMWKSGRPYDASLV
jgi:transposase